MLESAAGDSSDEGDDFVNHFVNLKTGQLRPVRIEEIYGLPRQAANLQRYYPATNSQALSTCARKLADKICRHGMAQKAKLGELSRRVPTLSDCIFGNIIPSGEL